jgi:hypothetical protein
MKPEIILAGLFITTSRLSFGLPHRVASLRGQP